MIRKQCRVIFRIQSRQNLQDLNSVKEMLEQFQHVDKLAIGSSLFMYVSELDMEDRLALPVLNSRCLSVNAYASFGLTIPGISGIAYALRSPRLESLVIKLMLGCQDTLDEELQDYWNSNGCTGLTCLVSHLKMVKIIDGPYGRRNEKFKLVFEFIEFLLKKARVLEKMIVVVGKPGKGLMSEICKKLPSMQRYSGCVSVELCST